MGEVIEDLCPWRRRIFVGLEGKGFEGRGLKKRGTGWVLKGEGVGIGVFGGR